MRRLDFTGAGALSGPLAQRPSAAAAPGDTHFATDAGFTAEQRVTISDGTRWRTATPQRSVLSYGADPTGIADSSAAFAAAIQDAALDGQSGNRFGAVVLVPYGNYKLSSSLDVMGSVVLRGECGGSGNGGSRLSLGTGVSIYLHSASSGPYYAAGGGRLQELDIYAADRPSYVTWSPTTAVAVGAKVRVAGCQVGYWECVVAGTTGSTPLTRGAFPDMTRPWTANRLIGYLNTCRNVGGRWDIAFVASGGTTGGTEPSWNFTPGETTTDGTVTWTAHTLATFGTTVADGTAIWAWRIHGVVMHCAGSVDDCYLFGFANAGISVIAAIQSRPYTNANSFRITSTLITNCGIGVYTRGGDANGGMISNVTAILIGYEADATTPLPWGTPGDHNTSGGHAFFDESFLGNTYLGCVAESVDGRGYNFTSANQRGSLISCYAESNCLPASIAGNNVVIGGQHAAGFLSGNEGCNLDPTNGISRFKILGNPGLPGGPRGELSKSGNHGLYTFTDATNNANSNYFGWSRAQNNYAPTTWAMGVMPYFARQFFGVAGHDAAEGPHWRDYEGHWRGEKAGATGGHYYLSVSSAVDVDPRMQGGGFRAVGWRQEPAGGYVVNGTRYIGRVVTAAGYEGRTWERDASGYLAASGLYFASQVIPSTPNGYVYRCVVSGVSGHTEPTWPTTIGATVADNTVTWQCVGVNPTYQYYGKCESAP